MTKHQKLDWILCVLGFALLFTACSETRPGSQPTPQPIDSGTANQDAKARTDAETMPDVATPCGPGYQQVIYSPRSAVYCAPIPGIDGGPPCGEGWIETWLGQDIRRCAYDGGSADQ